MQYNNVTVQALKDAFWTAKERVFHADSRPKNKGPIHALCLQLFAKGIIHLDISNHTKIGTETIMDKDVSIKLSMGVDSSGISLPAYTIDDYWKGINII
eukprot:scaffold92750_cov52-Cyclotella_meneghiniana.AAC.2